MCYIPILMWAALKRRLRKQRRVFLISLAATSGVVLLRFAGVLQAWEWATHDQLMRWRPVASMDRRIIIIEVNEADLQAIGQSPVPDGVLAEAIAIITRSQPRAIGLDIYRSWPVEPGHDRLTQIFNITPHLVGIEKLADRANIDISPPAALAVKDRVGFNNVIYDADGKVRRAILYWQEGDTWQESFALKLALIYLRAEGIEPEAPPENTRYFLKLGKGLFRSFAPYDGSIEPEAPPENTRYFLKLGKGLFRSFAPYDGPYVRADDGGHQILANYRGGAGSFETIPILQLLAGQVPPEKLRDRIVLIGNTAPRSKDFFETPYTSSLTQSPKPISGVELHANFVSQIVTVALDGKQQLRVWHDFCEILWMFGWAWVGAYCCWKLRVPWKSVLGICFSIPILVGSCYVALLWGWWLPLFPAALSFLGAGGMVLVYISHLETELRKSKAFLQSIIDTIADPVFVKDDRHRWIVLNQAFCEFIGQPRQHLLNRREADFFHPHEAAVFRRRDEQVFQLQEGFESEDQFTDAHQGIHFIATKRSLHRDAAGNVFLVGVMRDITKHKHMEKELKQKAEALARSNAELNFLAFHDSLTGLPNRKLFHERLAQTIALKKGFLANARVSGDRPVDLLSAEPLPVEPSNDILGEPAPSEEGAIGVLFLDLDGFKPINDTYGHDIGDVLLRLVAQRLRHCLRGTDTVARLGGDEFTILLSNIRQREDAGIVAQKICDEIAQPFCVGDRLLQVTTSVGISIYPLDGDSPEVLLKNADIAMFHAKEQGKNTYRFWQAMNGNGNDERS